MSAYDPIDVTEYSLDELKAAVGAAEGWGTYVAVHCYTVRAVVVLSRQASSPSSTGNCSTNRPVSSRPKKVCGCLRSHSSTTRTTSRCLLALRERPGTKRWRREPTAFIHSPRSMESRRLSAPTCCKMQTRSSAFDRWPYQCCRGNVHPLLRARHHQQAARRAPALFFDSHLLRGRRLRHSRSCQQQAHNQHTNALFRHGFISSGLQVLPLYFVTGRAVLPLGGD
jgi:hypothetical protein